MNRKHRTPSYENAQAACDIPTRWLMPRTKAGSKELKRRMNRILKLLELVEDKQLREMIKSNLPLSDDNYLD